MKLSELFLTQEDLSKTQDKKLQGLKAAIENGNQPEIHNAGGTIKGWAWGDLEKLGFAEQEQGERYGTEVELRWVYNGPAPITLISRDGKKRIMNSGDATGWVSVDYS